MTGPRRVQRKRAPGWRAPDAAIYVGRPTRWGNPFVGGSPEELVEAYRRVVSRPPGPCRVGARGIGRERPHVLVPRNAGVPCGRPA